LKKILGLAMVLVLAFGVTGCGGGGGGGGNDPIFPIEVSSNSKIIKTLPAGSGPDYLYGYDAHIEIKNISDKKCTCSYDIEFWYNNEYKGHFTNSILTYTLDPSESDTIVPTMSRHFDADKTVLLITVGTETKRFNIPIVTQ
jgi:hypothetical protein